MAIFNLTISDAGNFDTGLLDLNVYYGTIENFPTTETQLKNLNNLLIEKKYIELEFSNEYSKHIIALPSTINLNQILNVNNLYEDITFNFKQNNSSLQIEQDSQNVNYTLYKLELDRKTLENFKLLINLTSI
jgi:hypothetical protein